MIAFDLAYTLTLGAWCAHGAGFRRGLLVSALVFTAFSTWSLAVWPGWQGMYLVDVAGHVPAALASQGALLLGGYGAGYALGRRFGWKLSYVAMGWVALLLVLFGALWRRAFFAMTFADFHARADFAIAWGAPDALLGGPVMWFLLLSGAVNLASLWWLRRHASA